MTEVRSPAELLKHGPVGIAPNGEKQHENRSHTEFELRTTSCVEVRPKVC
jgi:hypothetical protein